MEALRERFGKYHVLQKIAQGGMAEVYKVKTVGIAGFEKIQALKRILPTSAREGRFIRSFIDEARIAVELTHRNIVQVFDFGKADGELFLAMELIEGKDLRTAVAEGLQRDMTMPIAVAAYVVSEVAAGLDYAHRRTDVYGNPLNIVHCDVSPSNVMLSSDGYVKILDFGIARASFATALERRRLRGKPRYMAPEQTRGEPPTAAADVFALGIIAWELFTGMPLFRGTNVKAILQAVRTTVPPPLDRLNPKVPPEIVKAVSTALARAPADRGTAADLLVACARTALGAGAHALAAWLGQLETAPQRGASTWGHEHTSSVVQKLPDPPAAEPPVRASTVSLANVPAPPEEIGEGTPGFATPGRWPTPTEQEVTATSQQAHPFGVEPSTTSHGAFDSSQTTSGMAARFQHEGTAAGVGRLADSFADDAPSFFNREPTVPTEPLVRQSYEVLQLLPGVSPASLRFDDEVTHQSAPFEHTSFDDLALEPDVAPADVRQDEPIDDDLRSLADHPLSDPRASAALPPRGRRRVVVVAATLAGAPPEVMHAVARSLGELAYQRGGVVLEQAEDALIVAFGLEVAGEDDVGSAMGWALDAQAIARDANDGTGMRRLDGALVGGLTLRIGGHTGVPVVPSGDEGPDRIPPEAIAEARQLAEGAQAARPLFVGAGGRISTSLYAVREVPAPPHVERSKAIEVVGPRDFEGERERLERRGLFVGRTAQLAELDAWFQRAIAADRRLVALISGEPGTGKSRLVAEWVARRSQGRTLRVVSIAASATNHLAPFSLIADLYQAVLGVPPSRGRGARQQLNARLQRMLANAQIPADRARAVVEDLDHALELRDGANLMAPEIADLRPRLSAGLSVFRSALADREAPLLTVIEDVHLGDSASLEVLRHALAVPARGPELLVLTARPDGPPPPAVDVMLSVGDLAGHELRALVTDRLGDAATVANVEALLARCGGNPLAIEELAQAVREAGQEVLGSARDVIAARLDRVSPNARMAARLGSVFGGVVRVRLLEELLDAESLGDELEELLRAGILVRKPSAAKAEELQFARDLVREVVYESMSERGQRDTHARIGRLLASRFFAGREEPPAVIAEHLERGGELAGAAAFWLRAGRIALHASDASAAVTCFSRTLALESQLSPTPMSPTARARRREALAGREEAHRLQGDLTSHANDLDDLQRLCEGDAARLADVALRRAQRMLRVGDHANASVATVVAEDHAVAAGDERMRGEALRVRAEILERLGRFDEALVVVEHARTVFHRHGALADEMAAMVGRGRILLMRAHYEAAGEAYRPVLALIAKTGDPWLERIVTNHVAVIEMCLGNFNAAMTSARRSLELCRRYGDRAREGDALSVAGIIQLEVGLYDQAAATFTDALEILIKTASRWSRADCMIYAGVCELRRSASIAHHSGMPMLDEALAEARQLGARYLEANALVARAGAHLRRGTYASAVEDAAGGVDVARQASLIGYEIMGLARQAVALAKLGGRAETAGALVQRTLELLERQKVIEGSEEEVYAACVEVLRIVGATDRAEQVRAMGRASAKRKLDALIDPAWKVAYAAIPEVRMLLGT
ncbi:MAG: protein kinase [Kofleriaceae bacterium]|nr:protein kinase [Kofleriaceae bacterium]